MISYTSPDLAPQYNTDKNLRFDVEMWQSVTIQVVGTVTGTILIDGSNDPGAVDSVSAGNAISSANFTSVQATNLATGSAVTSITAAGNYKITVGTRFIRLSGVGTSINSGKLFWFGTTPR